MYDGAFTPKGPTVLVGTTVVPVPTNDGTPATSYRVRALLTTQQYLAWSPPRSDGTAPTINLVTPVANVPSVNTMGFAGLATETVVLPQGCYMKADAVGAFEVTPGEGI